MTEKHTPTLLDRTSFIEAYASRSGLSAEFAAIGILEVGGRVHVALPCACDDQGCEGWAMVGADSVPSHLELYAPEPIRSAFRAFSEADADKLEQFAELSRLRNSHTALVAALTTCRENTKEVMIALLGTGTRDHLLLADRVHKADDIARAALSAEGEKDAPR